MLISRQIVCISISTTLDGTLLLTAAFPTLRAEDIREPTDGGLWVTPASGAHFIRYRARPNQKWNLNTRFS